MENDKLFDLMSKMYEEMQDIKIEMQNGFQNVSEEFKEVNSKIDKIGDKLNELEGTNAANHVAIASQLNKVSDELDFLNHKEFQTEREMYLIKQKLNKQRRNIK